MDNFSGKNQFPLINTGTPRLTVSLDTAENAQKEGMPVILTGKYACEAASAATDYPFGFILHGAENINDSVECTVISYEGSHEILVVASENIDAGELVSAVGYNNTEKKGSYAVATAGDFACGVALESVLSGEILKIRTQAPMKL